MLLVKNILTKKKNPNENPQKTTKNETVHWSRAGNQDGCHQNPSYCSKTLWELCADAPKQVKLCSSPTQERLLTLILPCKVHSFCLSTLPRYLRQALIFDRKLQVFELTHTRKGEKHQNLLHFPFSLFHSPLFHVLLFNTEIPVLCTDSELHFIAQHIASLDLTLHCPTSPFNATELRTSLCGKVYV